MWPARTSRNPPPQLATLAGGYGQPVVLDRASPRSLSAYPLIITRRDPRPARLPSAVAGRYYQAWRRATRAPSARTHLVPTAAPGSSGCASIASLARSVLLHGLARSRLVAAEPPERVSIALASASHPQAGGTSARGSCSAARPSGRRFPAPARGRVEAVAAGADDARDRREHRRAPARLGGGQLAGSSLVPDTIDAGSARIAAGRHRLVLTRGGFSLAPGSAGSALLNAAFLTPAGFAVRTLREVPVADWRALCGRAYQWLEVISAA